MKLLKILILSFGCLFFGCSDNSLVEGLETSESLDLAYSKKKKEAITIVEATGNPTADQAAIQSALDDGGTIHLKGDFDFTSLIPLGPDPLYIPVRLLIGRNGNDVEVKGEGKNTIVKGANFTTEDVFTPVNIKFSHLKMTESIMASIYINRAKSLEVTHCTINNTKGGWLFGENDPFGPFDNVESGIYVGLSLSQLYTGDFTVFTGGDVYIAHNYMDANVDLAPEYEASGNNIFILGIDANVLIEKNILKNAYSQGIEWFNTTNGVIKDNYIEAAVDASIGGGYGIQLNYSALIPWRTTESMAIVGNEIVCSNPFAVGTIVLGDKKVQGEPALIDDNDVTMNDSESGGAYLNVGDLAVEFMNNVIKGSANYGIGIANPGTEPNVIAFNQFGKGNKDFTSLLTDIVIDSGNAGHSVFCNKRTDGDVAILDLNLVGDNDIQQNCKGNSVRMVINELQKEIHLEKKEIQRFNRVIKTGFNN